MRALVTKGIRRAQCLSLKKYIGILGQPSSRIYPVFMQIGRARFCR
jgi:hypothetical protein